jgi:hypothetical protein
MYKTMTGLDTETICLTQEQHAVYSCICYFDIFSHPVTLQEAAEYSNFKMTVAQTRFILDELMDMELIFKKDGFYFLHPGNADLIRKRDDLERRFHKKQKTIRRFAWLISRFPFVESVSISGSCSKGLMDEDGDVDYFIITSPRKVWLCRTFLIAFKKLFLFNSKKYFCVNYFVDVDHLVIPDRNPFVAMEIKTLLPMSNKATFEKFLKENEWVNQFLPNKPGYNTAFLQERGDHNYLFGWLELLLDNRLGELLDKWCFHLTLHSWEKKFPQFNREEFDLNLRSKKNVSKHHPRGYQQKVLAEWHKKLERIKVLA